MDYVIRQRKCYVQRAIFEYDPRIYSERDASAVTAGIS